MNIASLVELSRIALYVADESFAVIESGIPDEAPIAEYPQIGLHDMCVSFRVEMRCVMRLADTK